MNPVILATVTAGLLLPSLVNLPFVHAQTVELSSASINTTQTNNTKKQLESAVQPQACMFFGVWRCF